MQQDQGKQRLKESGPILLWWEHCSLWSNTVNRKPCKTCAVVAKVGYLYTGWTVTVQSKWVSFWAGANLHIFEHEWLGLVFYFFSLNSSCGRHGAFASLKKTFPAYHGLMRTGQLRTAICIRRETCHSCQLPVPSWSTQQLQTFVRTTMKRERGHPPPSTLQSFQALLQLLF